MVDFASTTGITNKAAVDQRTNTHAAAKMLAHAAPKAVLSKLTLSKQLPANTADNITFRRVKPLMPLHNAPATEGVTPAALKMEYENVNVPLQQYISLVQITDHIEDFCEDPVADDAYELVGDQMMETKEMILYGAAIGGTNVFYSGSATSRATVTAVITLPLIRQAVKSLKRQRAMYITKVQDSSPNYATQPVSAGFVMVVHTDAEPDIRALPGFVPYENYQSHAMECEIGKVESVRFVTSPLFNPIVGAGSTTIAGVENDGTNVNVYPFIIMGKEALGDVALKGRKSVEPFIVPVNQKDKNDPAGQRGYIGAKTYFAAKVLNENWLIRIEAGVSSQA